MPYTIFHLDSERGLRGGERQLLYLASWLRGRGHRNVVVCRAASPLEARAREMGLEVLNLPFLFEWDPISAWKLRRRLREAGRAVVHAHTAHTAALAWWAVRGTRAVRVVHRRVDFAVRNPLTARLKYAGADRVIAITDAVKSCLTAAGVPPQRVAVVRSSIDPALIARQGQMDRGVCRSAYALEAGLDPGAAWIGTLRALDAAKDVATLLRACRRVLERRPRAFVLIGGDGPERAALGLLAEALGIGARVRFLGWRTDNLQFLKALDVFVLPSRQEGMGSVLLEAMACGTPVVASEAGGIPEVVVDGVSGLLAPARDPEALAGRILAVLEDPALGARLAAEAARRLDAFTSDKMGAATEALYDELLQR